MWWNITAVDEAGKKKLAYEIQKMNEAFYYFFSIDAVAEFPNAIASELRIIGQRSQILMR